MSSALVSREPRLDQNLIKRWELWGMARFGHLSVTLSNAGHAQKCVSNYCTLSMAMPITIEIRHPRPW